MAPPLMLWMADTIRGSLSHDQLIEQLSAEGYNISRGAYLYAIKKRVFIDPPLESKIQILSDEELLRLAKEGEIRQI